MRGRLQLPVKGRMEDHTLPASSTIAVSSELDGDATGLAQEDPAGSEPEGRHRPRVPPRLDRVTAIDHQQRHQHDESR